MHLLLLLAIHFSFPLFNCKLFFFGVLFILSCVRVARIVMASSKSLPNSSLIWPQKLFSHFYIVFCVGGLFCCIATFLVCFLIISCASCVLELICNSKRNGNMCERKVLRTEMPQYGCIGGV